MCYDRSMQGTFAKTPHGKGIPNGARRRVGDKGDIRLAVGGRTDVLFRVFRVPSIVTCIGTNCNYFELNSCNLFLAVL